MHTKSALKFVLLASLLAGCSLISAPAAPTTVPTKAPTLEFVQPTAIQPSSPNPMPTSTCLPSVPLTTNQAILDRASKVIVALKDKDMLALSQFIHPQLGVRFSPYAAVKDTDLVFTPDKLSGLLADTTPVLWGSYSGSGEPINLTFVDYFNKFVYDVDFANAPQVSLNYRLGNSTTMNNIADFYQGAMVVEYHFPGFDPSVEGMDWRSLRLVFVQDNNTWFLVGIVHDQWTT